MGIDGYKPVAVSRRIDAPAAAIFEILADPNRHPEMDGSGMLRGAASNTVISAVGDVFAMKMYFEAMGDYEMNNHVVEYEKDQRIAWQPAPGGENTGKSEMTNGSRWIFELAPEGPAATTVTEIYDCSGSPEHVREAVGNGNSWVEAMTKTLERLDELCAQKSAG